MNRNLKIVIDARSLSGSPAGVGKFLLNAIVALSMKRPEWTFILLANKPFNNDSLSILEKIDNVDYYIDKRMKISFVWFVIYFKKLALSFQADIVWYPAGEGLFFNSTKFKTLSTIHDVVCKELQHTMSLKNRLVNYFLFDRCVRASDMLWCVSDYTKSMIDVYYKVRTSKEIVVGSSINTSFFKRIDISENERKLIRNKYTLKADSRILLFVGTLEPRKNLVFLLSLMPKLAKFNYELLIVGGKGWGKTQIARIVEDPNFPRNSVHFAGYISDYDLLLLYNFCDLYVSTSLNEGFGMPQLEAIFCETKVVSSHNSAMIEVVSGAGITVDSWCIDKWVDAINNVDLLDINYASKKQVYSWDNISERVVNYIENNI